MSTRKHPITMLLHDGQSSSPANWDTTGAPVADHIGFKVEGFGQCADATGSLDGLVEDVHGAHYATNVRLLVTNVASTYNL